MDYSNFEIEDFASDDYFIRWVMDNDPAASRFWETYKLHNPEIGLKIDKARSLLLNLQRAEQTFHTSAQLEKTWVNIEGKISQTHSKRSVVFLRIAASVSIIVILSATWYGLANEYFSKNDPVAKITQSDEKDFIEEVNTTGRIIRIHLSDGSIVSLEDNSRLKYFKDHKSKPFRKVYLTGEAFFDIAKNPKKPFFVYANEVVTKVLGTSFRIKAFDNEKNILVSVKEGKVSVYSEKNQRKKQNTIESELNGVVLMPNQQVLYERTEDSFNKTLVETPEIIKDTALQYNFVFDNSPVKNVFEVLEEAYGVEIIFDADVLQNCFLTAPLGDEPLFEKLKIVCRTIGASYELIDAKIVISSKGCGDEVHN